MVRISTKIVENDFCFVYNNIYTNERKDFPIFAPPISHKRAICVVQKGKSNRLLV